MLQSYYLIPVNDSDKLANHKLANCDFKIFDFDSNVKNIKSRDMLIDYFSNLADCDIEVSYALLSKLGNENDFDINYFDKFVKRGFRKFVISNIGCSKFINGLENYVTQSSNLDFIIKIDCPLELTKLIDLQKSNLLNFTNIYIDGNKYLKSLGMECNRKSLFFTKQFVMSFANSHHLRLIDMEPCTNDKQHLEEDCHQAIEIGYQSKIFTSIEQLNMLHSIKFFTNEQFAEAQNIYLQLKDSDKHSFSLLKLDGRIFEKSHIEKILRIIEWNKRYNFQS